MLAAEHIDQPFDGWTLDLLGERVLGERWHTPAGAVPLLAEHWRAVSRALADGAPAELVARFEDQVRAAVELRSLGEAVAPAAVGDGELHELHSAGLRGGAFFTTQERPRFGRGVGVQLPLGYERPAPRAPLTEQLGMAGIPLWKLARSSM